MLKEQIENKLLNTFEPSQIEVINESYMHNVPAGSETHFKIVLASHKFTGLSRIARHRLVNDILKKELQDQIHALSLKLYTPDEWQTKPQVADSPPCRGGRSKETD